MRRSWVLWGLFFLLAHCSNTEKRPTDSTTTNLPPYFKVANIKYFRSGDRVRITGLSGIEGSLDGIQLRVTSLSLRDVLRLPESFEQVISEKFGFKRPAEKSFDFEQTLPKRAAIILDFEGIPHNFNNRSEPNAVIGFEDGDQFYALTQTAIEELKQQIQNKKSSLKLTRRAKLEVPTRIVDLSLGYADGSGLLVYFIEKGYYLTFKDDGSSEALKTFEGSGFAATQGVIAYKYKSGNEQGIRFRFVPEGNGDELTLKLDEATFELGTQHDSFDSSKGKSNFISFYAGESGIIVATLAADGKSIRTSALNDVNLQSVTTDGRVIPPDNWVGHLNESGEKIKILKGPQTHCEVSVTLPQAVYFGYSVGSGLPSLIAQGEEDKILAIVVTEKGCDHKELKLGPVGTSVYFDSNPYRAIFAGWAHNEVISTVVYENGLFGSILKIPESELGDEPQFTRLNGEIFAAFRKDSSVYISRLSEQAGWSLPGVALNLKEPVRYLLVSGPYLAAVTDSAVYLYQMEPVAQ